MRWHLPAFVLLLLSAAALPAYLLRFSVGPLPSTLLEVTLLCAVGAGALAWRERQGRWSWPSSPLDLPLGLWLVAGALGVLVAPDRHAALGLYRAFWLEPAMLYVVAWPQLSSPRHRRLLLAALAVGGGTIALGNLALILGGASTSLTDRPVFGYNTPNAVGLFLGPLIALCLAYAGFAEDEPSDWRQGMLLFSLIATAAVIAAQSLGGEVGLVVALFWLCAWWRRRLLGWGALLLAALATLAVPRVRARLALEMQLNNPNNTLVSRWHLWRGAFHLLRDHPVFGTGIASFQPRYIACCLGGDSPSTAVMYPHNLLLNTWVETGIPGVAALAWLLVRVATLLRPLLRNPQMRWLGIGLAGAGLYTLVHGLIDVPLMKNDLAAEAALLLALLVGALPTIPVSR